MSDEQTIYIGPEDDLTNVRGRLERVQSHRVTLVIPTQTQLRSHVAWKLLHARARELGKDVLIISADPQIRSVAQAVKFKVAYSLESPPPSGSRSGNRTGRTGSTGRGRGGSLRASGRRSAESRSARPNETLSHPPEIQEPLSSSPFGIFEQPYGPSFDHRIRTTPPIRPLSPEYIEEEPDLLLEDFKQAQDIREAATMGSESSPPSEAAQPPVKPESMYRAAPLPRIPDDPYAYMKDSQPPPKAEEQRGRVTIEASDALLPPIQHISEHPTNVIDTEIEDMGDQGHFELFSGPHPMSSSEPDYKDKEISARPSRRSGAIQRSSHASAEERTSPAPESPSRSVAASKRSEQLPLRGRPVQDRPASHRTVRSRLPVAPLQRSDHAVAAQRRGNGGGYIFGIVALLLVVLFGVLAYFGPSATVRITFTTRDYAHALKLTAMPKGQQKASAASVFADVFTKEFSKNGTGRASGTKEVGNQPAIGRVIFINDGKASVTIPSGTIVATAGANGKLFVTTATAVALPPGSNIGNNIEVPIQAQQLGVDSNVESGTIIVIPDDSLNQIAKANNTIATDLKLQVNNPLATTEGGVGDVAVVTRKDLDETTTSLRNALNDEMNRWVQQQKTSAQDMLGKPAIQVALVKPPAEGTIANNGLFQAQVRATVTVMVVHHAAFQEAALSQLKDFLSRERSYTGYIMRPDPQQPLKVQALKTGGEGTSLTLDFTATAQAVPNITEDQVRGLISGKSSSEARDALFKELRGVQDVDVKIAPEFATWPFWQGNIHVEVRPGTTVAPTPTKN